MRNTFRTIVLVTISFAIPASTLLANFCGNYAQQSACATEGSALKVGFVFIGPVTDKGWNATHNEGRLYLESKLKGKVSAEFAENVSDGTDCERVLERMVAQGDKLIFTTSYGFLEHAERVAARHPDVYFVHVERPSTKQLKNLSTCIAYHWEPEFVAGVVAGRMTKTNRLGFVGAHAVPQVLQTLNSFALGAHSVNPKAKVRVVWTNTWADAPLESEAANALIDQGADVVAMQENSPMTIVETADGKKAYSVGFHCDLKDVRPNSWLTGEVWDWGPLYVQYAQSVIDGKWKPGNERFPMKSGYVKLARFGDSVPKAVQADAAATVKNIESGRVSVFQGPLNDQNGKQLAAAGQTLSDAQIDAMDWLAQSVEGKLPKR